MMRFIDFSPFRGIVKKRREWKMNYKVFFTEGDDGYVVAECPAIPGCISQGKTKQEAMKNIKEAIELCLECYKEDNEKIPEDTTEIAEVSVSV